MEKLKKIVKNNKFDLVDVIQEKKDYVITMGISNNELFHVLLASISKEEEITAEIMTENMFFYILDGEGKFEFQDKEVYVKKGDSLYIPHNTSYGIRGIGNFKFMEIGFLDKEENMSINLLEKAKVMKLNEMIDIEEGKVLSKNLASYPNVVMTLMSFGKGESLASHTAPGDALIRVLEGTAIFNIDGTDFEVSEGESIILPANINHAVVAKTAFKMLLTIIINR